MVVSHGRLPCATLGAAVPKRVLATRFASIQPVKPFHCGIEPFAGQRGRRVQALTLAWKLRFPALPTFTELGKVHELCVTNGPGK